MGRICGFTGINDKLLLKKMCDTMSQGVGRCYFFIDDDVSLCSRVLNGEVQLAGNEDENVWIVLDGEIYNNILIKQFLEENGHSFRSSSDAELIVHLYEEYGEFCVKKLRGAFAFAIWDSNEKKLLLARDRAGERPLFYSLIDGKFFFASEIRSLMKYEGYKKELSLPGLNYFLSWGHIPASYTLLKSIRKLLPAHILIYNNGEIFIQKYWELYFSQINYDLSEDDWCKTLYDLLLESISVRLKGPPFGVLLGGIDSSGMASLMRKITDETIKSFTVYFNEERTNEPYAKFVADWLGLEVHERILQSEDIPRILPKIVYLMDDPKAQLAATIPTYLALELCNERIKTIFTADGADVCFWGYPTVSFPSPPPRKARFIRKIPRDIRERIIFPLQLITKNFPEHLKEDNALISEIKKIIHASSPRARLDSHCIFSQDELQEVLTSANFDIHIPFLKCLKSDFVDPWDHVRFVNKLAETVEWGISRLERFASYFSLNLKLPFEDWKVKEVAARIPPYYKQKDHYTDKYIWRKMILMYNLLPKKVIFLQKRGFGEDTENIFRTLFEGKNLRDYVHQNVQEVIPHVKCYINETNTKGLLHHGNWSQKLALLIFALWYKTFILNSLG
jgi:asparagine synthase (glutamine-hydrolysing)